MTATAWFAEASRIGRVTLANRGVQPVLAAATSLGVNEESPVYRRARSRKVGGQIDEATLQHALGRHNKA